MSCEKCHGDFEERFLELSHDVPCYLFKGDRKRRKNQSDKFGRTWLCSECHNDYELFILNTLSLNFIKCEIDIIKFQISYYMKLISNKCSSDILQNRAIKICQKQREVFFK